MKPGPEQRLRLALDRLPRLFNAGRGGVAIGILLHRPVDRLHHVVGSDVIVLVGIADIEVAHLLAGLYRLLGDQHDIAYRVGDIIGSFGCFQHPASHIQG